MTEAEARSQACRLAEALSGETDPVAVRAALHGLTAQEANRVVRAAAPLRARTTATVHRGERHGMASLPA
ncbi:hypothetical protein OKC48_07700 [Methylorubrum extorquens]|uniref:hypothetical protein n=1 Tax=Methylorubrum extorquens TaxID=408 RepID=UPI0022384328|nr:hypothetical protein [Methylorubrum extorquens]UYW28389.1 hypothetical protein OKC48_07700 [Methylorubrum extorquens]